MEKINLTINGKTVYCLPEKTIFDAAKDTGIRIPNLCNHPHLEPVGACRLCIVEEEKTGRIFASCVTPVSDGMSIKTDSPEIRRYRSDIIRLMIASHPESCILCNQGNRCELRQIATDLGVGMTGLYPMDNYRGLEEANPFIIRDLNKCVLCGRCIRADHDLVQVGAIDYNLRGIKSLPTVLHGLPLEKSDCTFCGTCVSLCPTGALMTKSKNHTGSPQKESRTICGFCGAGCSLNIGSCDNRIVDVNPSHRDGTVNLSTLCVRGHFAHDYLNAPERLVSPMVRKDNALSEVSWEEAFEFISRRLNSIKKENGSQSIGFMGSSKCSNEENYLFQKMARVLFKTNNIDNGGFLSGRAAIARLNERLGNGEQKKPLEELEKSELIFVLGSDPTHMIPVAGYYIKRASRIHKVPLIVADSRKTGLHHFASLSLRIAPETEYELINSLAALLCEQDSYNPDYIKNYTSGFDDYKSSLGGFNLEKSSGITGIEKDVLKRAVSLMKGKRMAFLVGSGVLQRSYAVHIMDALVNLALMSGSLAAHGIGIYILTQDANQNGALHMGSAPDLLPGYYPLRDETARGHWHRAWNTTLSPDPGLDMIRTVEEAEKGNIKALYIMGENPLRSLPQPERVKNALSKLDLLIVQDILATETTNMAHALLPGAAFSEKEGSFTNMEGRIQFFNPVIDPPGNARPDWIILDELSAKIANSKKYETIKRVRSEISRFVPMYETLDPADNSGWISGKSRIKLFTSDGVGDPIAFTPLESIETGNFDRKYRFKAILTSSRYHLGCGTRTSLSDRIKDMDEMGDIQISFTDGKLLGLNDNDIIKVSSPYGSIIRKIRLQNGVQEGTIQIPKGFNNNDAIALINLGQSGKTESPELKYCNVKIDMHD